MTIDDKRSEFSDKLNRRISEHDRRYAADRAALADLFHAADDEWRQSIAERRRAIADTPFRTETSAGFGARRHIIHQLDRLMWRDFKLSGAFPAQTMTRYPVIYCETPDDFFAPMFAAEDLSDTERRRLLAETVAHETTEPSGILGVNLPGDGCYINGWLFGKIAGKTAQAALEDAQIFPQILQTACHEKLGHGFIAELTAVGQEKTRVGLWRFDTARQFNGRTVDTPHSAELAHKHALLHHSTKFAEEGWATWIEQFMLWRAGQEGLLDGVSAEKPETEPTAKYSLGNFLPALQLASTASTPDARKIVQALAEASQILLAPPRPVSTDAIAEAMSVWETYADALDSACATVMGQPALYVLGYFLLKRLEAQLGWRNLPYAIALAGNVTFDLAHISVNDLATVLHTPRLNVNTRLAMLATLTLTPEQSPADLARMAHDRLSFAIPAGW